MKERRIAIEQAALHDKLAQQQQTSTSTGDASIDNVDFASSTTTPSSFVSSRKKPSAAERIGYRKGSGGGGGARLKNNNSQLKMGTLVHLRRERG